VGTAWEGQWQGQLRAKGYRLTPQRQLVLEAIAALGHATPDEICSQVRLVATGVNISTVYRTLDLLEELALITHTHLGHGAPTYHVADDEGHVHLVCRSCGKVAEVSPDVVSATVDRLAEEHGFAADVHHFAVFGRCAHCKDATFDNAEPADAAQTHAHKGN
jgi:Fur family transcriptional regulator, ferric uptake regulator